jgi:hypothetical protein
VLERQKVSPGLTEFIIKCLQTKEDKRYKWEDVFGHNIFKKYLPIKITPDTTTIAWWRNKYRQ